MLKPRDKINLINRAIAALETPADLTREEVNQLIDDLDSLAQELREEE